MKLFKPDSSCAAGCFNLTKPPCIGAAVIQCLHDDIGFIFRDHSNHADAAVEGAVHLHLFDIAVLLQPLKNARHAPAIGVDNRTGILGKHTRQVLQQAAAGDVCQCMYSFAVNDIVQRGYVNFCGSEQGVSEWSAIAILVKLAAADLDNFTY